MPQKTPQWSQVSPHEIAEMSKEELQAFWGARNRSLRLRRVFACFALLDHVLLITLTIIISSGLLMVPYFFITGLLLSLFEYPTLYRNNLTGKQKFISLPHLSLLWSSLKDAARFEFGGATEEDRGSDMLWIGSAVIGVTISFGLLHRYSFIAALLAIVPITVLLRLCFGILMFGAIGVFSLFGAGPFSPWTDVASERWESIQMMEGAQGFR